MAETDADTIRPLPYFPLSSETAGHRMDTRAGVTALINVETDKYGDQCRSKATILESAPGYYFQCPADALPMAWETVEVLLPHLALSHPQHFSLQVQGNRWTWINLLLSQHHTFALGDETSLPYSPLDWLGRQLQEDMILMRQEGDAPATLAAGHLCFAAGWCLDDKRDQPFLAIHAPIPGFNAEVGPSADKLMRRLKVGRPVERVNWSLAGSDHWDRSPRIASLLRAAEEGITPQNVPEQVHFRVERQTLSRLPRTGAVLFTIHTYLNPLRDVLADPERTGRLYRAVKSFSDATIRYKGMTGYYEALMTCLARAIPCCADD